jgi:hypothetical protein
MADTLSAQPALASFAAALTLPSHVPTGYSSYLVALASFGKIEQVREILSQPGAERDIRPLVLFRPEFDALRRDPRFIGIAARFGLVAYWRSTGEWPDFCRDPSLPYKCEKEALKYH